MRIFKSRFVRGIEIYTRERAGRKCSTRDYIVSETERKKKFYSRKIHPDII